jgi:hypothetical protein
MNSLTIACATISTHNSTLDLAIILVVAKTNRYSDVKPLIPAIESYLARLTPGQLIRVSAT